MNERIKELRKQAWKEAYNVDPADPRIARAHHVMEEGMAKFAELIVKECLDILDDEDDGVIETRCLRIAARRINNLFGVEV